MTRIRLKNWYVSLPEKVKKEYTKDIIATILTRRVPCCNFIEWKNFKIVYQRYANLFFCVLIDASDNELLSLELVQRYVEILDQYFGNVCELDIIFNFEKALFVWNEISIGGEVTEVSRREVLTAILDQDDIQAMELEQNKET